MKKKHVFLFMIMLLFLVIKLIDISNARMIWWDEAVYLGIGKYIYSLGRVGLWEEIRPLGLPLLFGLIWKLKLNLIYFSGFIEILFSLGNIVLVYLIAIKLFNQKIASIAILLFTITPVFLYHSSYLLTGIPSTFFALLAIYYFISNQLIAAGILTGIASLFRFPQGILIASLIIILLLNKTDIQLKIKQIITLILSFLAILAPFLGFNYYFYNKYHEDIFSAMLRPIISGAAHQGNIVNSIIVKENIPSYIYNLVYYMVELIKQNPLLAFFLVGAVLLYMKKDERFKILFIPLVMCLAYFTYSLNKQLRFSLIFLPYICILASYGLYKSHHLLIKRYKRRYNLVFLLIILSLLAPLNTNLDQFNLSIERKPPILSEYYKYFFNIGEKSAVILSTDPRFAAYSDVKVIPNYNNVGDAVLFYQSYMAEDGKKLPGHSNDKPEYVAYTENFYPCLGDQICEMKKSELLSMMLASNELIVLKEYNGDKYYLFMVI